MLFQYYQYYGGSGILQSVLQSLNNWGFVDAFLPFLLIFTLLFIVLKQSGKNNLLGSHAGTLAFTLSLLVIIPHVLRIYPPSQDPIVIMNQVLPQLVILLLSILMLLLLMGLVGSGIPNIMYTFISVAAIILLILAIVSAVFPAFAPSWLLGWFSDPNFLALIIILVVMGLVVYFVTADSTPVKKSDGSTETFIDKLDRWSDAANKIFGFGGSGGGAGKTAGGGGAGKPPGS